MFLHHECLPHQPRFQTLKPPESGCEAVTTNLLSSRTSPRETPWTKLSDERLVYRARPCHLASISTLIARSMPACLQSFGSEVTELEAMEPFPAYQTMNEKDDTIRRLITSLEGVQRLLSKAQADGSTLAETVVATQKLQMRVRVLKKASKEDNEHIKILENMLVEQGLALCKSESSDEDILASFEIMGLDPKKPQRC